MFSLKASNEVRMATMSKTYGVVVQRFGYGANKFIAFVNGKTIASAHTLNEMERKLVAYTAK